MNRPLLGAVVAHSLFWGWNLLFLLVVHVGIGPTVGVALLLATVRGVIPWHVTVFLAILLALPIAGAALGAWKLRHDPGRLLTLFYGVQAPLMALCLVRLFAIQALTPATLLALAAGTVGCIGLLRTILGGFDEATRPARVAREVAQTVYLCLGLWWGALVALVVIPLTLTLAGRLLVELPAALARTTERSLDHVDLGMLAAVPVVAVWVAFFAVSAVMLSVFPIAMVGISIRAWQLVHRTHLARDGRRATFTAAATACGLVLAFATTSRQPQGAAFAIVTDATTDAARRDALRRSADVRAGLLNARLADVRYVDGDPSGHHVADLWKGLVGERLAEGPRALWRALTWPFVYHPVHAVGRWGHTDRDEAEALYAAFFDAPMARAERDALLRATRQTWSPDAAEASLLEIGQRKVHLDRQVVDVRALGDHAVVTVHDVYRGQTWNDEEIHLSFSLADGAVPTGLWMGPTDDRDQAFRFVVAPRGAAQAVYEREVRRRVDPALLEQVGPRQYRLRAFPIPARTGDPADPWFVADEGPEVHLWLEYATPIADDGTVPMPVVSEVRNLFWDTDTRREPADTWVPPQPSVPVARRPHTVQVGDWRVTATPAASTRHLGRTAVFVDDTRSMEAHRDAIADALRALDADVYCVVEQAVRPCPTFDPATALFWGSVAMETRLVDLAPMLDRYDALVVLTDTGSYELAAQAERVGLADVTLPALWLVHFGGMPVAYPDWTLDRMQRTGGGAVTTHHAVGADPTVVGGWRWEVAPAETSAWTPGPWTAMAARQVVAHLDRAGTTAALHDLDAMHAIARGAEIVTPYTSMIVLVNDPQRDALAKAAEADDRFDREVSTDEPALVTAAPEPGTWLLVMLGGAGLLAQRRRAGHPGSPAVPSDP